MPETLNMLRKFQLLQCIQLLKVIILRSIRVLYGRQHPGRTAYNGDTPGVVILLSIQ